MTLTGMHFSLKNAILLSQFLAHADSYTRGKTVQCSAVQCRWKTGRPPDWMMMDAIMERDGIFHRNATQTPSWNGVSCQSGLFYTVKETV
jgi:hypothetical protein